MKKAIWLLLCFMMISCNKSWQNSYVPAVKESQAMPSANIGMSVCADEMLAPDKISYSDNGQPAYVQAYTDFLLNLDNNRNDFTIWGYYLFDLNFDRIPELGVLHDSGGSMGGYFRFYYFDGNEIVPVFNDCNESARYSSYARILANNANGKVYMLKEMYLLEGNENGLYGYVREIVDQNGLLYVCGILNLSVDQTSVMNKSIKKSYGGEDTFLSDAELEDCLITQYYSGGEWHEISSSEYLKIKRELIPVGNSFVDLLDTDICVTLYHEGEYKIGDDDENKYKRITAEEIDALFAKWLNK